MPPRKQSNWNEERIHRWLAKQPRPKALAGSQGHDAAVLAPLRGRPVICTDQVVEGVHAELGTAPRLLGRKAVARTFSDLAACGATPHSVTLALRLPAGWADAAVRGFISGARAEAIKHGADLVGGDLTSGAGGASATVTAIGELTGRRRAVGRDRARPGQVVLLSGPTGGSRLGRHLRIAPRLAAGRALHAAGATAMIDISDGLWIDAERLARASSVRLELRDLPLHRDARRAARASGRAALEHALGDGEDHELIATLSRRAAETLLAAGLPDCPGARIVGRVLTGRGLLLRDGAGQPIPAPEQRGFVHGGQAE